MTTTKQTDTIPAPDQEITTSVEAGSARLAAEELFQSAREAKDQDQFEWANRLEVVAIALWRAGWDA